MVVDGHINLSSPTKVDISVYRGDTGHFRITVSDEDGDPVNMTGATWDGDIRLTAAATTTIANFVIVPVSGDPSSIDVTLDAENSELLSGPCVYDIEMRMGDDVTTLIYGSIVITQDVSRP